MINKLKDKVKALALEVNELSESRNNLIQHINSIDTRITQIAGAIETLNELIDELKSPTEDAQNSPQPPQTNV